MSWGNGGPTTPEVRRVKDAKLTGPDMETGEQKAEGTRITSSWSKDALGLVSLLVEKEDRLELHARQESS